MTVTIRPATPADAVGMSAVLAPILKQWNSARPSSADHILGHYVRHANNIACTVACAADGTIVGFQSLQRAGDGNVFDVPAEWGIIGTYVALDAPRGGIGRQMFAASLKAAKAANLPIIDATIGADNDAGLAYYGAMGFETYRHLDGAVGKRYNVECAQ